METDLSIFKGDLSDQRHTLVLSPGVGQVEVGERAEVDHVRNVLPQRFVDHVVSPDALGLRYGPVEQKKTDQGCKNDTPPRKRWTIQDTWALLEWILGKGSGEQGSPKGSQECAVISKDVGNLFIRVVVLGVLAFKVADDISLTPLLDEEGRNEADRSGLLHGRSGGHLHPGYSPLPSRAAPSRGRPAAAG